MVACSAFISAATVKAEYDICWKRSGCHEGMALTRNPESFSATSFASQSSINELNSCVLLQFAHIIICISRRYEVQAHRRNQ